MDVLVNRYRVRHNGVVYGPGQPGGQLIEGLSEEEGTLLIEQSNGSIQKYTPPNKSMAQEKRNIESAEITDDTVDVDSKESADQMVNINADDLIKPAASKRRGK